MPIARAVVFLAVLVGLVAGDWTYGRVLDASVYAYTERVYVSGVHPLNEQARRPRIVGGVPASEYYVSPTGAAAWGDCLSSSPLSGTLACSMTTAIGACAAGDVINIRGGVYNVSLAPACSGTLGNPVTFQGYPGETAEITNVGATAGIQISGRNHLVVTRLTVHDVDKLVNITGGSNYIEISWNAISVGNGPANVGFNIVTLGATALTANTNNWIHHNTIYNGGYVKPSDCNDISGMMVIGGDEDLDSLSDNNTVEDNTIYWGAHHGVKTLTHKNVVRNNVIHNEGWMPASTFCQLAHCAPDGLYGNRVLNALFNHKVAAVTDTYNVIEGNRLGFAGLPSDGNGADVLTLGGKRDIARYNVIYAAQGLGFYARQSGNIAQYLMVYNNTFAFNGLGPACRVAPVDPGFIIGAVRFPNGSEPNYLINNIINQTTGTEIRNTGNTLNTLASNWQAAQGDPLFTNTDYSNPFDATQPDFRLQSGSGAINNGTYLATANGAGTGATSIVFNTTGARPLGSLPFQDGTAGSALSDIQPDCIAIGTVSNIACIVSINRGTETALLDRAMTWADGAFVWLYSKSDGVVVLLGSAPDQGAFEKQ